MNILLNKQNELRSGWKFVAYWVVFIIILFAISLLVPFANPQSQLERFMLNALPTIPALGALLIMARFVDKVPVAKFGVAFYERWKKDFAMGAGISAGMLAVVTVVNGVFGGIVMTWSASDAASNSLIVTPLVLIMSAAQEELVFRGYPLQMLMKAMGPWPAMLSASAAFGLVHSRNPEATVISVINTMLAGLMLSIAYWKTRSLWLPYGLHLGWNVGLGFVLGYPLSGFNIDSFWTTVAGGPKWLVGGTYGPEAGFIGTIVFIAATVGIYKTRKAEVSPRLRELLSEN